MSNGLGSSFLLLVFSLCGIKINSKDGAVVSISFNLVDVFVVAALMQHHVAT
ncbi:MAG: hypothetical protein WB586_04690 [Chthoniobacterales bacterium]